MALKSLAFISTAHDLGGGELFAVELLNELKARGWSITLVAPPDAAMLTTGDLPGLDARIGLDLAAKVRRPFAFIGALLRWFAFVRKSRAPLIYGNGFETLKWVAAAKKIRPVKVICHLHESYYEHYDTPRARLLSRKVDRFFAISETVRSEYHRGSGVELGRIVITPNGVPFSGEVDQPRDAVRSALDLPLSPRPVVVMVARTDPLKGQETLLRALPRLLQQHPDTLAVFLGIMENSQLEKELVGKWRAVIKEMGIQDAVRFLPYRRDARRFMRAADLVVVPSISEGFGRTAIEAMAEKTPVLASRVGGLAEIIQSGMNGVLVPASDPNALAEAMSQLLSSPAERERLAAGGFKCFEEHYSTKVMTDRIEGELLALLSGPGA